MVTRPHSKDDEARQSHPVKGKALFEVETPQGRRPYVADEPTEIPNPPDTLNPDQEAKDNPDNPRGRPSLSLPQQTTPLQSQQGVFAREDLEDPAKTNEIMLQDGLAPDNPLNPHGTPDYIVEGTPPPTEGVDGRTRHTRDHGHGRKQNSDPA